MASVGPPILTGWRRVGSLIRRLVVRARTAAALFAVDRSYRRLLGRRLDDEGRATWTEELRSGRRSARSITAEVEQSAEYRLNRSGFYDHLHAARIEWVRTLPAFPSILDIGGSSPTVPEGALIELGYRHRPVQLHIVDRPPDEQFHGAPAYEQRTQRFPWGSVVYHHGSAESIEALVELTDLEFDCIFMGQTIEHIEVEALAEVLGFVRSHLAVDGEFIFDTPNRAMTRLVTGDNFIAADHTHEYEPDEMARILQANGFVVRERTGILDLPGLAATHEFDPHEARSATALVDDPSTSFVFAFRCGR